MTITPRARHATHIFGAVTVAVCFGALNGCYDGSALIEEARNAALNTRLAEIDLGAYQTVLPHNQDTSAVVELEFRIFGTVGRYSVPAVEHQLAADGFRVRHETLVAVRKATLEELADPDFVQLRERIETVVNSILTDAPVKSIGFYEVRLVNR